MLEKIFGSNKEEKIEELKSQVENKEKEIEKLKKELKKENKRAKEAITKKQKTDKELKEAKHKIESLEDRIKNLEKEDKPKRRMKESTFLQKENLMMLIDELESLKSNKGSLVTNYIKNLEEAGRDEIVSVLRKIESETGYIHLQDRFKIVDIILVPPFPIESEFYRGEIFRLEKIRKMLESEKAIGFVSAHAGRSAVGLVRGDKFEKFSVVKSGVRDKHSKGGFSQGRFERGREEQIQRHSKKIMNQMKKIITNPDYVILDGNEKMISSLRDRLSINVPLLRKSLDIGNVKKEDKNKYLSMISGASLYIL